MRIDPITLLVLVAIGQFLSVFLFFYYILSYRNANKILKLYTLGRGLQFIAILVSILFSKDLSPFIMSLTIASFFPGFAIETYCLVYANKSNLHGRLMHLLLFSIVFVVIYAFFSKNIIARVFINSVFYVVIYSFLFYSFLIRKGKTSIQKLIGYLALVLIVINLFRGGNTLLNKEEILLLNQGLIQKLWGVMMLIIALVFPTLFLFILSENDNTRLNELNITKDKFFRIIGHDLKGPIGQMIQISQLIEENYKGISDENLLTLVKALKESSARGFKLLENLLDWARSQTGSISFKPGPFSISELINENMLLLEKQAESKNIQIIISCIQDATINADRNMINTVVRNLISNAIKFTRPGGKIEIHCQPDNNNLIVSVRDNGVGLSYEDRNKLFRIDSGHTTLGTNNEEGTGIGLILCKEFIDKHNGEIWIDSKLGEGSTFSFSIPEG